MSSLKSRSAETQATVIVIGAGERGQLYSQYALEAPDRLKVVGVADPKEFSRKHLQKLHNIPEDKVFDDWSKVISHGKFADAVIITTPDKLHRDIAVAFANEGYHILLEKPMATTEQGCRDIAEACQHNGVMLSVCLVLRHYPPMCKIKEMIDSGAVGEVINIQHVNLTGYWHFAHSFVRGSWCCEEKSTFSLLAHCCHDVDLLSWWMNKYSSPLLVTKCTKVSSFGSLCHFRKENKPNGASSRCLDCKIEQDCCYSAKKIYLDTHKKGISGWPVSVICDIPSVKSITDSLQHGPYGRCVYDSDNDVCDNQVMNLSFSGGQTASLTMVAFTESLCKRIVRIFGTKGELTLNADGQLQLYDFLSQQSMEVKVETPIVLSQVQKSLSGYAIADYLLMENFVEAVARKDPSIISTSPEDVLTSHLLVIQAEKARRESCVISLDEH